MEMTETKLEEIWKNYSETKSKQLRDMLIIYYSSLVNFIAGRLHIHLLKRVDFDDLVSYGIFGLIDAIDKFDYEKGIKFETYASLRIRGSIIDSIRKMDWIPRDLRQKSKMLEVAFEELTASLNREPTDEELAVKLSISLKELHSLFSKTSLVNLISLDEYSDQNHEINLFSNIETPEAALNKAGVKEILAEAIESLQENEKKIVALYYFEELTLKEIGEILGVSISRVSQIHSKTMLKLRAKLGKYQHLLDVF